MNQSTRKCPLCGGIPAEPIRYIPEGDLLEEGVFYIRTTQGTPGRVVESRTRCPEWMQGTWRLLRNAPKETRENVLRHIVETLVVEILNTAKIAGLEEWLNKNMMREGLMRELERKAKEKLGLPAETEKEANQ